MPHLCLIVIGALVLPQANVLISTTGEPLLCDFGLAVIVEELTQLPISTAMEGQGNPRWMAPELLVGEAIVSTASDVYAFGMLILEVSFLTIASMIVWAEVSYMKLITLDVPFAYCKNSALVIMEVHRGTHPEKPVGDEALQRGMTDETWGLCLSCWSRTASQRPLALQVMQALENYNQV